MPKREKARGLLSSGFDERGKHAEGKGPVFERVDAVERGYCEFRVHLILTVPQAMRLAESISVPDGRGSGDAGQEPPARST